MIGVKKLRWKNVLSYGNNWTELVFENGKITLFHGENGNGKSAFYEALFFCLYGKPFRKIKKGGLVNNINGKELLIEIELEKSGKNFLVRRGIKPDIFEIYVDGALKPQPASIRDYQDFLETHVLQMDEKTFKQSVILGSTDYVPFMQLSAGERRIVVEDFLNVGIYSTMAQMVKVKISSLNQSIREIDASIQVMKLKIEMKKAELERISGKNQEALNQIQVQIGSLKDQIRAADEEKDLLESRLTDYNPESLKEALRCGRNVVSEADRQISSSNTRKGSLSKEMRFLHDNATCPTCTREIGDDFKKERCSLIEKDVETIDSEIWSFEQEKAVGVKAEEEASKKLDEFQDLLFSIKESISKRNSLKESLARLEKNLEAAVSEMSADTGSIRAEMKEIAVEGKSITARKTSEESEKSQYEAIAEELKDGGIKNKIIRDYLPSINKLIRKYVEILEFPINFSFDEDFQETILSRGREDFSYGNFSKGESLRLDLALLFTWREITRIKSSAYCNLLVLDEIGDSSLDAAGFDAFMKILNSDRQKQSVMIISHKPQGISSRVDKVIEISKKSGFSIFSSVTENEPHEQLL